MVISVCEMSITSKRALSKKKKKKNVTILQSPVLLRVASKSRDRKDQFVHNYEKAKRILLG